MFRSLHDAMRAHAAEAWPAPACGVVVGVKESPEYIPAPAVSDPVRETFRMDIETARRFADQRGGLLGFVVSHPCEDRGDEAPDPLQFTPSAAEMTAQMSLAAPFGVVVCAGPNAFRPWWFGDQCPPTVLMGRPFRHGVTDCYSFIRDWFRADRGIRLPDFPRDWEWWRNGGDLYRDGFLAAGGRPIAIEEAGSGDVILCRIRSDVTNHALVLLPEGWFAHHFGSLVPYDPSTLSTVAKVRRWVRSMATHALRWREDMEEPAPAGAITRDPRRLRAGFVTG